MKDLIAECLWHRQSPAFDQCAGRSRHDGADVTSPAADGFKHERALLSVRSDGSRQIPRWCLRGAQKTGETVDVVSLIIGHAPLAERGNINAKRSALRGKERSRDAHLVYVGIRRKTGQAGMLILPSEAPRARLSGRFQQWYADHQPGNSAARSVRLR